ncbi:type I glutamate--ammonia ligase [Mycolicibacterium smegmatis]|nr:glutamine synthetase family protein [Mycolicibacterium smegmatis]ABK75823.1 glutamine synthetase [Mycolicibacterium smegmatis MC2 155]AIU08945.1 glutamine synthetase [Mycolicibacterium smegmatis MC2 155]AIU15570.1 glutamine synthetase [Mycolicibacterium smegmatis]AIU22193.1 glutamine synthetase [Mycolicibacterium smegmatis]MBE9617272.1 glutamine synthetase [Mycolicibacterium smegmatis]
MADHVAMTQLEVADYDLGLRGKLVRSSKTHGASGLAFCTILYGLSLIDDVTDTPFSNAANGYPDAQLVPDETTRVALPWRHGTDAVIAELVDEQGRPLEVSPRAVLAGLAARYGELGLAPVLGYEYELWIFRDGEGTSPPILGGRPAHGRTENAYSLTRCAEINDIATEFVNRMDQIGIEVEMFHAELGPGFFEFTLAPETALRATDNAARARQYLRDLCAERGLHASFMAKPFADKSGAGGHVHSSLTRDGNNVFSDGAGALSAEGSRYLAGLLAGMADTSLMLNPHVNSYKRIDPEMFTPALANWGYDDRGTSARVILPDAKSARVEHRRPGADASPYLVAAALLAAGLRGLQEELPLPERDAEPTELPGDLAGALAHFENSTWLPDLLGKAFCTSYAATRRAELQRYEQWLRTTITDWELHRHLEHQ